MVIPVLGRLALFVLGAVLVAYGLLAADGEPLYVAFGCALAIIGATGNLDLLSWFVEPTRGVEEVRARVEQDALIQEIGDLQGVPDHARRRELNARQMRVYQDLSTGQAKSSYRRSQFAFVVGLALIVAAVALAFVGSDSATKIAATGAAGLGGALSAYISRTYIRTYERTLDQLNFYYREPLVNSYLLTAELLLGHMSEDKRASGYDALLTQVLRAAEKAQGPDPGARQSSEEDG